MFYQSQQVLLPQNNQNVYGNCTSKLLKCEQNILCVCYSVWNAFILLRCQQFQHETTILTCFLEEEINTGNKYSIWFKWKLKTHTCSRTHAHTCTHPYKHACTYNHSRTLHTRLFYSTAKSSREKVPCRSKTFKKVGEKNTSPRMHKNNLATYFLSSG